MLFRRYGSELFDIHKYYSPQNTSTIKYLPLVVLYNWCQCLIPGRSPAVAKHCPKCLNRSIIIYYRLNSMIFTEVLTDINHTFVVRAVWYCGSRSQTRTVQYWCWNVLWMVPWFVEMFECFHSLLYIGNQLTFMFAFGYILQSCDSVLEILGGIISSNRRTTMTDKEVPHTVPRSQTTKMPVIMLHRAEEMFPALKEGTVSVVCYSTVQFHRKLGAVTLQSCTGSCEVLCCDVTEPLSFVGGCVLWVTDLISFIGIWVL
jgi:hypothetical protein